MRRRLLPVLLASALLAAGCGGSDGGSEGGGKSSGTQTASAGKDLFRGSCGSCHTLADAGTSGSFGPNLDNLKPAKELVLATIKAGPGPMPAGLFKGAQADTVATYVSSVAGK